MGTASRPFSSYFSKMLFCSLLHPWPLDWCPPSAMTKAPQTVGQHNRNIFSHSCGVWETEGGCRVGSFCMLRGGACSMPLLVGSFCMLQGGACSMPLLVSGRLMTLFNRICLWHYVTFPLLCLFYCLFSFHKATTHWLRVCLSLISHHLKLTY